MQNNILPYCTESGHEFTINQIGNKSIILCFSTDEEVENNNISKESLIEMIESAKTFGIEKVELHTNYAIEVHSHTLKSSKCFQNFKIVKPCHK